MPLTFDQLKSLVAGDAVAIRGTATLEPAGGPGDKVFPPTHALDDKNKNPAPGAKYAFETRRIRGQDVTCVLLDSVQSQANRMEEALQALWADKQISLPVVSVDFSEVAPEVGRVTSLTAPHRIADALLRDSLLEDQLFRLSEIGRSFTDASTKNASALFKVCPTGLVFGLWDSTGPKGGLGAKFQRALVSEIVGLNAVAGSKTESRIDPLNILKKAADIYVAADVYRLPFVDGLFDAATMIRVLHHMADAPKALGQVKNVLASNGTFILEFANKLNLKAIFRYLLGRQKWNPFTLEPVEFVELNFDFHPKAVQNWLKELGFSIERILALSHFRVGFLKRIVPTGILVFFDSIFQWTGALWQVTPSMFVKAVGGNQASGSAKRELSVLEFFKCPDCGQSPLVDKKDYLECSGCKKKWEVKDGIYDFREPL